MKYDFSSLSKAHGTPKHIWVGPREGTGGVWQAAIWFDDSEKPDLQVRNHLSKLLGIGLTDKRFPKVVVANDEMWRKYPCYEKPSFTLDGSPTSPT